MKNKTLYKIGMVCEVIGVIAILGGLSLGTIVHLINIPEAFMIAINGLALFLLGCILTVSN